LESELSSIAGSSATCSLLSECGFEVIPYVHFLDRAISERMRLGTGRSFEINVLFRFWQRHLPSTHSRPMYDQFRLLATEDAACGNRHGLERLYELYVRLLSRPSPVSYQGCSPQMESGSRAVAPLTDTDRVVSLTETDRVVTPTETDHVASDVECTQYTNRVGHSLILPAGADFQQLALADYRGGHTQGLALLKTLIQEDSGKTLTLGGHLRLRPELAAIIRHHQPVAISRPTTPIR
jgi:hypothetical protein